MNQALLECAVFEKYNTKSFYGFTQRCDRGDRQGMREEDREQTQRSRRFARKLSLLDFKLHFPRSKFASP